MDLGIKARVGWAIIRVKEKTGLSWSALADKLGTNKDTVAKYAHNKGGHVKLVVVEKLATEYEYSSAWLLEGEGEPFLGAREKYPDVCGPPPIYKDAERAENGSEVVVGQETPSYGTSRPRKPVPDPYRRASAHLLEIYNYGDPGIIEAIQANLATFLRTVRREVQVARQTDRLKELEEKNVALEAQCEEMKEKNAAHEKRIAALEERLKELTREPSEEPGEKKAA